MKLFEKLKNAIFEEEDEDEEELREQTKKEKKIKEKKEAIEFEEEEQKPLIRTSPIFQDEDDDTMPILKREDRLVKKIDVEKTFENDVQVDTPIEKIELPKEEKKTPIIFSDEDFMEDTKEISFAEVPKKEDKILYGGYEKHEVIEKPISKFTPSPVISPVYGVLDKNYKKEESEKERKSLDELFASDRNRSITLDEVRQKAFGDTGEIEVKEKESTEDKTLLYEMQSNDEAPAIEKVTLGDAEEYYSDLGLEYEVDYKDKSKPKPKKTTRVKDDVPVFEESVKAKPKTANEIRKEKSFSEAIDDEDNVEEKNLYDLIDMMYDSKDKG